VTLVIMILIVVALITATDIYDCKKMKFNKIVLIGSVNNKLYIQIMNKLDISSYYLVTSFLHPGEIKILGQVSKNICTQIRSFMTYSYNQHGDDDTYYKIYRAKWIVYKCDKLMFEDCMSKKLILVCVEFDKRFNASIKALSCCINLQQITFGYYFNQSIEVLSRCINLQQITFGSRFNRPIEVLANCTNLQQITFGYEFNQPIEALAKCTDLQ